MDAKIIIPAGERIEFMNRVWQTVEDVEVIVPPDELEPDERYAIG